MRSGRSGTAASPASAGRVSRLADVAVVTLNWNGKEFLPDMVRSLAARMEKGDLRLVVFDNGSTDGSDRMVEDEFGEHPWFSLVRSDENLGFALGANTVLSGMEEELVVLANTDVVFEEGSIDRLLETLRRRPRAGLVGPMLLWPGGSLQPAKRDFPFPGKLLREHLPLLRRFSARFSPHDREESVDWVVGAVMAIRMEAFREVGGFEESFFFYHEETDLQYRLWRHGWEVWFQPQARVVHLEGGSARQKYGRDSYLYYIPAKLRFLDRHGTCCSVPMFRVLMTLLQLSRLFLGLLRPGLRRRDNRFTADYCSRALGLAWSDIGRKADEVKKG